jgi:hypothetical protein
MRDESGFVSAREVVKKILVINLLKRLCKLLFW